MDSCWEPQTHAPSEAKLQNGAAEFRPDGPLRAGSDAVEIPAMQARRRPEPAWCKASGSPLAEDEILHRPHGAVGLVEVEPNRRPRGLVATTKPQQAVDSTQLPEVVQELLRRSNAATELTMKAYDDKLREVRDEVSQLKGAYAQLFKNELSALKYELSVMRKDFENLSAEGGWGRKAVAEAAADLLRPDLSTDRSSLSAMRKDLDEVRALAASIGRAAPTGAAAWDPLAPPSASSLAANVGPTPGPPAPPPSGAIDFFMEFDRTRGTLGIEVDDSDGTSLQVTRVHEGLLGEWNGLHPEEAIRPGDRVVAVDGCGGDAPFLLAGAQRLGRVKLTVRRYARGEQEPQLAPRANSKDL